MALSTGAVDLPMAHLSARVAWHDTDWTGRVCAQPAANHACTVLRNIKERKDSDAEEAVSGQAWVNLADEDDLPPCVFERAGFMRSKPFTVTRTHTYARGKRNQATHGHFLPTAHRMPAHSVEAVPYRWTRRESALPIIDQWGIGFDQALEDRADDLMTWSSNWVQDHRNQLALLDTFFSAVRPGKSLLLLYAKDVPLLEDRPPGARILIGAGIVTELGPSVEWSYSGDPSDWTMRSVMWERAVSHSIRSGFNNGFLLPYQSMLNNPDLTGEDMSPFVAHAPADHFEEFSYVSEHVGHDGVIAALLELTRVVDLLPGVADGPWEKVASWLSDRIADAWGLRGPYPGLGSALGAAGLERGALIAHRVIESLSDASVDPWVAVSRAIDDAASNSGPAAGLVGRMARKAWQKVSTDSDRFRLLRLLSRFPLTSTQARRLFDPDARAREGIAASDADLLGNPYLLYEADRGRFDAVGLHTLDRGLFPRDASARAVLDADPLPDPVTEAADDRRVRAACAHLLERAAGEGHTLLDEPRLRRRMAALDLDPLCDPTSDLFELAAVEFPPVLLETPLAENRGRGWQLARLAYSSDLIAGDIAARIEAGSIELEWDWRTEIDASIDEPPASDDEDEETARAEKADALRTLTRSRIAVLVGPAGTGKTTMLKALCAHPDVASRGVLLLAPTGKGRVQLGDKVGSRALTIAQFLRPSGRWHPEFGYRVRADANRESGYATVVIDEASMLTEEMVAALIDSVSGVVRLVLCGDHRQLPPIGAGRPFADLVRYLRDAEALLAEGENREPLGTGGGLAELTVGRRQRSLLSGAGVEEPTATLAGRDDLAVASLFSVDGRTPAADEALARVLRGDGDGTLSIIPWRDEDDLHVKMVELLTNDPEFDLTPGDGDALKRSLGATGTYNGRASFNFGTGGLGAEHWQILSPVRSRPGGVAGLNRLVRRTWRAGDATAARRSWKLPPPMGADEVLFHDKVMCVANHPHKGFDVSSRSPLQGDVANGEIGMVVHWPPKRTGKPEGLKVEFSTQPGLQFTFWESDLNGERERQSETLEVAYAITIHKSQGSQFAITLVVIPNPCALLSPELIYTALTRQRNRTFLFIQGDPADLRLLTGASKSETARRLTRLFRAPDPFETPEGVLFDGSHVHRTAKGEMVLSKSEVIVANTLRSLAIQYLYEVPLRMPDGTERLPDFTIDLGAGRMLYWEHLGMLGKSGYLADWEAKKVWYADHGILPWTEGGGVGGTLEVNGKAEQSRN